MSASQPPLQQQLEAQRQKVDVDHFDLTVRELARMSEVGELKRAPVYQRKFRWDEATENRLIESVLLGLPIPSIFVATNEDGSWEVVDGLQRISTLIHFTSDSLTTLETIGKAEPLRLSGLTDLTAFNNFTLADLPAPVQLAFFKRGFRVTALSDKSNRETRFELFERLNAGGVALSPQEVRAAIYRGPFNDMLRELAYSDPFKTLVKLQKGREDDGTREELVLKFFAYLEDRESYEGPVTEFLNHFMERQTDTTTFPAKRTLFMQVAERIYAITGGPFRRSGYGPTPLVELEAILVGAAEILTEGKEIVTPPKGWQSDKALVVASTGGTNTRTMLRSRIGRAKELLST
ncbi:MAG TPA: DUF262 domain-containing protein [Solirubrobacteraceae bacterium]|nr:DUF262 domain-containing protein [Solirubrobacteraceae bacterium]